MEARKENKFLNWIFKSFSVTAEGLGLYRIFSALFILIFLLPPTGIYDFLGSLPSDFYQPPPGPMWLLDGFPPSGVFYVLHAILIISLVGLLAGFKTRWSSISTGIVLLVIKGLFYSVGKINHDLLVAVVPVVMAFSGWGSAYSVDSLLRSKNERTKNVQSWPLVLLALMLGFMMFTAGFPKILGGWLQVDTQATFGHLYKQYFLNGRQDLLAAYALNINSRFVWELFDYTTILFETGFLLAILHPGSTRLFVSLAIVFHFSVMMLMNIAFIPNIVVYAAFIDWSRVHSKIKESFSVRFSPVFFIVLFYLILRGIIFLGVRFNTPALNSDLRVEEFYILIVALPVALYYIFSQIHLVAKKAGTENLSESARS